MVKTSPQVLIRSDGSVYHKRASLWQRQTRGFVSFAWGPLCVTYLHTAYTIALYNEIKIAKNVKIKEQEETHKNPLCASLFFCTLIFRFFVAIFIYCWHVYSRPRKNWANCMELFNEIQVTIILVSSFSELMGRSQITLGHWIN